MVKRIYNRRSSRNQGCAIVHPLYILFSNVIWLINKEDKRCRFEPKENGYKGITIYSSINCNNKKCSNGSLFANRFKCVWNWLRCNVDVFRQLSSLRRLILKEADYDKLEKMAIHRVNYCRFRDRCFPNC